MSLNAIVPARPIDAKVQGRVVRSRLSRGCERVQQLWQLTQISRLGHYSVTRREVLNTYCRRTSLIRVVAVSVVTPLPALLLAIILECIPLQNPMEGWKANYGTWIRICSFVLSATFGSLCQIHDAIPTLSHCRFLCTGIGTGCGSTLVLMAIAALWGVFPVPFLLAMATFPFEILFMAFMIGSIRRDTSSLFPAISPRLKYKLCLILAQSFLVFVYIAFVIIFKRCSSTQQIGLLVILPMIKLACKHSVAWLASDDKESIPAVVVFTVDVFNGLFVSSCIQSSESWWTSFLLITLNIARILLSFWDISRGERVLRALDNISHGSRVADHNQHFLVSSDHTRRQSVSLFTSDNSQRRTTPPDSASENRHGTQAVDLPHKREHVKSTPETILDRRSCKMLFHLEYLILVVYIESVVPTLYVIYLLVLVHLPSAKYYYHTQTLTSSQLHTNVGSIMLYASVEIITIVWLHVILKRKFGFSLLYQLAFVLETEKEILQGRLFVWIAPLLQITLFHFGIDFSFQFDWLKPYL